MGPKLLKALCPVVHGLQPSRIESIQPELTALLTDTIPTLRSTARCFDTAGCAIRSSATSSPTACSRPHKHVDDLPPPGLGNRVEHIARRGRSRHMPSIFPCGNMSRAGAPVFRASEKRDALSRSEHESSRVFGKARISSTRGRNAWRRRGKWGFWSWRLWISRSQRDFDRINDRIRKAIRMTATWKDVRRASIPVADLPALAELRRSRGDPRVHGRGCRLDFLGPGIRADAGDARPTDLAIGQSGALYRARRGAGTDWPSTCRALTCPGATARTGPCSRGRFSPSRYRQRDRRPIARPDPDPAGARCDHAAAAGRRVRCTLETLAAWAEHHFGGDRCGEWCVDQTGSCRAGRKVSCW